VAGSWLSERERERERGRERVQPLRYLRVEIFVTTATRSSRVFLAGENTTRKNEHRLDLQSLLDVDGRAEDTLEVVNATK
jgi:hypothetical protein